MGGTEYIVSASSTSGLGVTLTIDTSTSSVCALPNGMASGSGTVSFTDTGTCKINANQGGDATFPPATLMQQSFTVGPGQGNSENKIRLSSSAERDYRRGYIRRFRLIDVRASSYAYYRCGIGDDLHAAGRNRNR